MTLPGGEAAFLIGRCHMCGAELIDLPPTGRCPACEVPYTPETARRLKLWPSAFSICLELGWPLIGLAVCVGFLRGRGELMIIPAYLFLLAMPVNSYFRVRILLKRHLPQKKRTTGVIALLRHLGTAVCVIAFLFFLLPFIALAACLIISTRL